MKHDDLFNQLKESTQTGADGQSSLSHKYYYNNPNGFNEEELYANGSYVTGNRLNYNKETGQITGKQVLGSDYVNSNLVLQYDNSGRLKSVGVGVANNNYFYSNYKYTGDKLNKIQTNGQSADSASDTDNATYEYYPDGKLKKITYPKLIDSSYLTTEYLYNPLGRMTSMTNRKGSTVLSQYTYTHDANGNITTVNDGNTTKTYLYDKLNRLIEIQPQTGIKTVYSYDLRGNRLTESGGNFNLDIPTTNYQYDLENKLQTVTKGNLTTSMKYYADGLRAKKESTAGYTHYIYNLSGKLVAEAQNSSVVTFNYVWGPGRVLFKKEVGGVDYYYLYNGHGDVVQIVDRNGNVVNNYEYDEWATSLQAMKL